MEQQNGGSTSGGNSEKLVGDMSNDRSNTKDGATAELSVAVEGIDGVDHKDVITYFKTHKGFRAGTTNKEMINVYNEWAAAYDEDVRAGRYNGPEIAAQALALYYSDDKTRATLKILDVAAGTGQVGEELAKLGFTHLDALEPSKGMLKKLKQRTYNGKPIYSVSYQCAVGVESKNELESDIYDCVVAVGAMGEGLISVSGLEELIRFVKPGGTVFIVMREDYLSSVKEYVDRLEPFMDQLEKQGLWKRIARNVVPHYCFDKNGVMFSYQVSSNNGKE